MASWHRTGRSTCAGAEPVPSENAGLSSLWRSLFGTAESGRDGLGAVGRPRDSARGLSEGRYGRRIYEEG